MNLRHLSVRSAIAAAVFSVVVCGSESAADAPDRELLDVLLENESISQEQYDRLKPKEEPNPDPEEEATSKGTDPEDASDPVASKTLEETINAILEEQLPVKASYTNKGFRFETRDGNWQMNLQWRFQFRFTYPYQGDPRQLDTFADDDTATFQARRLRMKIGGHGYRPWLKYYFEVDLQPLRDADDSSATSSARVIDWRVDLAKWEPIGLRVGQWKIDYNRERVDSSGRQQFVERSIVNRIFTIDRQIGVQLRGRLFKGTPADMRYYAGVFNGQGRGVNNDDTDMMYVGRLQWNFMGRDLKLRQTDVERTAKPTGTLSFGASHVKGRCTRWSSSGCGNLDGFTSPSAANDGQFKVDQLQQGFAFKYQGLSIQQEFHYKRVEDRENDLRSHLYGVYAQTGYFFHELCEKIPEPLELAFRYAYLREPNRDAIAGDAGLGRAPNDGVYNDRQEFTAAANWFFAGHNNKITVDYSYLTLDDDFFDKTKDDHRFRLQWDVSF